MVSVVTGGTKDNNNNNSSTRFGTRHRIGGSQLWLVISCRRKTAGLTATALTAALTATALTAVELD